MFKIVSLQNTPLYDPDFIGTLKETFKNIRDSTEDLKLKKEMVMSALSEAILLLKPTSEVGRHGLSQAALRFLNELPNQPQFVYKEKFGINGIRLE